MAIALQQNDKETFQSNNWSDIFGMTNLTN
jgi:hypothetical protein